MQAQHKVIKRINVREILANLDLRHELMVRAIVVLQAREGISTSTTYEQAEHAYCVVTAEKAVKAK